MPIAIIGMSCRFPGGAVTPDAFWDMLVESRDCWSPVPPDRFNQPAFYNPVRETSGTTVAKGGYFIEENLANFDAPFFNINVAEAKAMDPQHRLFLEVAYEALENAGIPMQTLPGSMTSVYAAADLYDYSRILDRDPERLPAHQTIGIGPASLPGRVSHFFDLKGPSIMIDTGCSGSLVAMHQACQGLRTGEARQAIVGASHLNLDPGCMLGTSRFGFVAEESRCYSFDSRGTAFGMSEGVACIILKPWKAAVEDGDSIRAVIRNTVANHDGQTAGLATPGEESQIQLIRSAYEQIQLDPRETSYFEAHGTGTQVGDPIESRAINTVMNATRPSTEPLLVGSVKSNIGHLQSASEIASVIKTVLMLERGLIPANMNLIELNPRLGFDLSKTEIPREIQPWPAHRIHRTSINNFGYGGTNAHAILEGASEFLASRQITPVSEPVHSETRELGADMIPEISHPQMVALTGASETSGPRLVEKLKTYLNESSAVNERSLVPDLAYTLSSRRSLFNWRFAATSTTAEELLEKLNESPTFEKAKENPRLAFVFTGQGAQWHGMGRELLLRYPVFYRGVCRADEYIKSLGADWSVLTELNKDRETSRVHDAAIGQPLCAAIQMSLVDLLASWNIRPHAVAGHSAGEVAASYAYGALSFESALAVAYYRGLFSTTVKLNGTCVDGAMLAVGLSEEAVAPVIAEVRQGDEVLVAACINSPSSVTVSGDQPAVARLQALLETRSIFVRKVPTGIAYHTPRMERMCEAYGAAMKDIPSLEPAPDMVYVSSVTSNVKRSDFGGPYWTKHLVSPARFSSAIHNLCNMTHGLRGSEGLIDTIVEIGPHAALQGPIKQILGTINPTKGSIAYVPSLIRERDATRTILDMAGKLFCRGHSVDLNAVNFRGPGPHPKLLSNLSPYPWDHSTAYWHESRLSADYRHRIHPRHQLLGAPCSEASTLEPQWRLVLRTSQVPWICGHKINSRIVFPGAGYISMAIEASRQHSLNQGQGEAVRQYKLAKISFKKALYIPDDDEGVEILFSLRPYNYSARESSPEWNEFSVLSYSDNAEWNEHCRGMISLEYETPTQSSFNNDEVTRENEYELASCQNTFSAAANATFRGSRDINELYRQLGKRGYDFQAPFTNLTHLATASQQALGVIRIPDTAALMPKGIEAPFVIHPATLDACLQMTVPMITTDAMQVPTFIEELSVSGDILSMAGSELRVQIASLSRDSQDFKANIVAAQASSLHCLKPVVAINGVQLSPWVQAATGSGRMTGVDPDRQIGYQVKWVPDTRFLDARAIRKAWPVSVQSRLATPSPLLNIASQRYARAAVRTLSAEDEMHMLPHHRRFYNWLKHYTKLTAADTPVQCEQAFQATVTAETGAEGQMLCRIGSNLDRILKGEVEPLSLMLEDNLLYDFYDSAGYQSGYEQLCGLVSMLADQNAEMEILEIGAGTGGATEPVLRALNDASSASHRFQHYCFTDISSGFFEKAKARFAASESKMTFKPLNIENDPSAQGFSQGEYDLIIATNVLHATRIMDNTMRNVRQLLKPGGRLLIFEDVHIVPPVQMIFGVLPGWWLGVEDGRTSSPHLDEEQWNSLVQRHGFSGIDISLPDFAEEEYHRGSVMLATAVAPSHSTMPFDIQILHPQTISTPEKQDFQAIAQAVGDCLDVRAQLLELTEQVTFENKACIFLAEIFRPLLINCDETVFLRIQNMLYSATLVIWVTRGATLDVDVPESSLITGLLRTVTFEDSSRRLCHLDLDHQHPLSAEATGRVIGEVFRTWASDVPSTVEPDHDFAERNGRVLVPRITADGALNQDLSAASGKLPLSLQPFFQDQRPLMISLGTPGLLNTLHFEEYAGGRDAVAADEVLIQTRAVGVNFRDVALALGQIKASFGALIQNEVSGIVLAVGADLAQRFQPGDRVFGFSRSSYASVSRLLGAYCQPIPPEMSFEEAASIPVSYTTAYYSLAHAARLQKGESVLIHSGAGGFGQAAIRVCQGIGAEVYTTVGSEEKKKFLVDHLGIPSERIFSSRRRAFVKGIRRLTSNRGVDVVVNSLAREALQATCQCVAEFGRFVEIGITDINNHARLDMAMFERSISFLPVDLAHMLQRRTDIMADVLRQVTQLISNGDIGLEPPTTLPITEIESAFRRIQAGTNIGKIVLTADESSHVQAVQRAPAPAQFSDDASYLIVGGLGGLGRQICRWMAGLGAKNIILLSRTGADTDTRRALVTEMELGSVNVLVSITDVGDKDSLRKALYDCSKRMPPIRGIIHGGLELKDGLFQNMTFSNFQAVIQTKVQGTLHLQDLLSSAPLDFFVLLSSCAGLLGNKGQANYAAASTFQDAFARFHSKQGRRTVSIDLGMIQDAGYWFEKLNGRVLFEHGLTPVTLNEFLSTLNYAMTKPAVAGPASQIVLGLSRSQYHSADEIQGPLRQSLFSPLRSKAQSGATKSKPATKVSNLHELLNAAQSTEDRIWICCDALMAKVSNAVGKPVEDISPSRSPASYGVDSLIAVELKNWMAHEFSTDISTHTILSKITISQLAERTVRPWQHEQATEKVSTPGREIPRAARMRVMIEKYTSTLNPSPTADGHLPPVIESGYTVILTGSTGFLGIYLLDILIKNPAVTHVYCLDRSKSAVKRNQREMRNMGCDYELAKVSKVEFLHAQLGERQFGLQSSKYEELQESVNVVIHNAWMINLLLPLEEFEGVHIRGVQNLIDFSLHSRCRAHILFLSSITTFSNWTPSQHPVHKADASDRAPPDHEGVLSELLADDPDLALVIGYSESKYVAERILSVAASQAGVPVTIARLDQIMGSSTGEGMWRDTQWFPAILKISRHTGQFPDSMGGVIQPHDEKINWVTVDKTAQALWELVTARMGSGPSEPILDVFHIQNPHPSTWHFILQSIQTYLKSTGSTMDTEIVSYSTWLQNVNKLAKSPPNAAGIDPQKIQVALEITQFFPSMTNAPHMTPGWARIRAEERSPTLKTVTAMSPQDIMVWAAKWGI